MDRRWRWRTNEWKKKKLVARTEKKKEKKRRRRNETTVLWLDRSTSNRQTRSCGPAVDAFSFAPIGWKASESAAQFVEQLESRERGLSANQQVQKRHERNILWIEQRRQQQVPTVDGFASFLFFSLLLLLLLFPNERQRNSRSSIFSSFVLPPKMGFLIFFPPHRFCFLAILFFCKILPRFQTISRSLKKFWSLVF